MDGNHLAQDIAKIGRVQQVAPLVELVFLQPGPLGQAPA